MAGDVPDPTPAELHHELVQMEQRVRQFTENPRGLSAEAMFASLVVDVLTLSSAVRYLLEQVGDQSPPLPRAEPRDPGEFNAMTANF